MKEDKFLITIVVGIVLLVVVALAAVLLRTPENQTYVAEDTPAGIVHNYFLAIQRKDFEKAYGYLSDELESKPTLEQFISQMDNQARYQESALSIGETRQGDELTQVDITLTTYRPGALFESQTSTNQDTAYLQASDTDGPWKLIDFPYPYWGYNWNDSTN